MGKLTKRAKLYLSCCPDWSADWEIASRIGDTPPPDPVVVRAMMGRLIGRGLAEWSRPDNTYRASAKGRAALKEAEG